jgi:nicotinamidase/pyrazinamidase
MAQPLVFFDVDTQADFMLPAGSLFVKGAEGIVPNLKRLMDCARARNIPVLSSADAHAPDDPSFAQWPPHCVVGTPGQLRIPETSFPSALVISNRPGRFEPPREWSGQYIVEKQEYDATTNVNFSAILQSLGERRFVVFGVATEYCVRGTALGLRALGKPVDLVTDAIREIKPEDGRKAIDEMVAAGVRLVKTEEVCGPLTDGMK